MIGFLMNWKKMDKEFKVKILESAINSCNPI